MGTLQEDHKEEVWECVLYLRDERTGGVKLAYRASISESELGSISEVRFTSIKTPMLQVQHPLGRTLGDIHREHEEDRGERVCEPDTSGSDEDSKSVRPLPKPPRKLSKPLKKKSRPQLKHCPICKTRIDGFSNSAIRIYCSSECGMADIQRYVGETPMEAMERRAKMKLSTQPN